MRDITDILDYVVHWRSKSKAGFVGELFHIVRSNSGGSSSTPIGYLIGFIEPSNEYSASHWKILVTVRDEIRYNLQTSTTYVFVKSAYASKLKYKLQKLGELTKDIVRVNPKLPIAIQEELIRAGFCTSPLEVQMITGKNKYVFSDVEFNFDEL